MKKYFLFSVFFFCILNVSFSQMVVSETSAPFILANAIDTALSTYQSVQNSLEELAYTYRQLEQTTNSLKHLEWNDINSIKQSLNTISDAYFQYNNTIRDALDTPVYFLGNYTTLGKLPTISYFDDYKDPFDINNYKGIKGMDHILKRLDMYSVDALINDLVLVKKSSAQLHSQKLYSDKVYKEYEEKRMKLRDSLMNDENPSFQKTLDYLAFSLDGLQSLIKTNIDLAAEQQIKMASQEEQKERDIQKALDEAIALSILQKNLRYNYNTYKETIYTNDTESQIGISESSIFNMEFNPKIGF